jgi:hypothetical protein
MLIHRPYFAGRESRGRGNRHAADELQLTTIYSAGVTTSASEDEATKP